MSLRPSVPAASTEIGSTGSACCSCVAGLDSRCPFAHHRAASPQHLRAAAPKWGISVQASAHNGRWWGFRSVGRRLRDSLAIAAMVGCGVDRAHSRSRAGNRCRGSDTLRTCVALGRWVIFSPWTSPTQRPRPTRRRIGRPPELRSRSTDTPTSATDHTATIHGGWRPMHVVKSSLPCRGAASRVMCRAPSS
jgi:hypothetical protein